MLDEKNRCFGGRDFMVEEMEEGAAALVVELLRCSNELAVLAHFVKLRILGMYAFDGRDRGIRRSLAR